jgi:argininosuccinate lyase
MMHVSRLSEELILWLSPRFGFIDLPDRFCTGSSIMPQKKNPDVPELARGKTGRVNGDLIALLTLMKGQPLAYNKDNQEDKEPLFDAVDTVAQTIQIFADMVPLVVVKPEAMLQAAQEGFATATDLADYLVKKGMPFRDAHEAVAHAVKLCLKKNCALNDLSLAELIKACGLNPKSNPINNDIFTLLSPKGSVDSRNHVGGTAPKQVITAIKRARTSLKK